MDSKVRVQDIAKEFGLTNKEVIEKSLDIDIDVKSATSAIKAEDVDKLVNFILTGEKPGLKEEETVKQTPKKESAKQINEEVKKDIPQKIEASIKKEEIKEVKQNVAKKQEINEEPLKEEVKETIADASLKQRRGLVIIKKKKVEPDPEQIKSENRATKSAPSLESMFASVASNMQSIGEKRIKKRVKKSVATKKEDGSKIDFLSDRELSDNSYDSDDNMVVLPDLTIKMENIEEKAPKKSHTPGQVKTLRPNKFLDQGIQRQSFKRRRKKIEEKSAEDVKVVKIPEDIRVYEFAEKMNKQASDIIKVLFNLGMMVTKNDFLEKAAIEILAEEFGVEVNVVDLQDEFDYVKAYDEELSSHEELRAPVITIMGHVDHGKTSLLDYIRSAKVASSEAGGITQHVGAYMVEKNGKKITFIDTPGHEAFSEMRSRGAEITDIVIIVVAADDGVKQQTKEAISHAKAANVPIIIAINKMDKPAANPDNVKSGLAELGIMPIDWGGENEFAYISAKTGDGIEALLDLILLQADVLELKADPTRDAKATVVESSMEKGRGSVATVIVKNGTLKVGDTIVAGVAYGKIKALLNANGKNILEIKPGEPGVIVGLSEVPNAGEILAKVANEKVAREYAQKRADYLRQKELSKSTKVTIDDLGAKIAEGALKSLKIILKADTQGSLEALKGSLNKIKNDETIINIIHSGVGGISENDIVLTSTSENSVILGFNVRPTGIVKEKAKSLGVEIKTYNIIYNLIDDVKVLLSGMMAPIIREEALGQSQVREVFVVPKIGAIAGCIVTDGTMNRGAGVRLIRSGVVVYEGKISSLKRFKDDAKEVSKGYECGIGIEGFNDIKEGDFIESFKTFEEKVVL